MVDSSLIYYVLLFILLELYEVSWQKADTLLGVLSRLNEHYSKNVWLFLMMQPTFFFGVVFMMMSSYNLYAVMLFSLKASDILTKMLLVKKVFIDKEVSSSLLEALVAPLNSIFLYLGVVIYPTLIYLTLYGG